jgi:hypothetical protein
VGLFDEQVTFRRLVLEGRAQLGPELATECERAYWEKVYWAERTWGMSDQQLLEYLQTGNRVAHLIDASVDGEETLH